MDIIVIITFMVSALIFISFYFSFYWTLLLLAIYFFAKYFDGSEYTGFRASSWFRRYRFGTSIKYWVKNKADLYGDRLLFVVMGNFTHFSLLNGFGLHGNFFDKVDLVYMMPPFLFRIPFVRDFLLWTGAVTWKDNNHEKAITDLFHKGKCVVYPLQNKDLLKYMTKEDGEEVSITTPDKNLIDFVTESRDIYVVPVLIHNDLSRYAVWKSPRMKWINQYFYKKFGWPFPFMCCPRICSKDPPPKVNIHIGNPIKSSDKEQFRKVFLGNFEGLFLLGGDDELNEVILH